MAETVEVDSRESPEAFLRKLHDKPAVTRDNLLVYLDEVIRLSFEKLNLRNTNNSERQGWARVINSAVASAAPLLRDAELSELKERLEAVEKSLGIK